jgi:hypothetical protein
MPTTPETKAKLAEWAAKSGKPLGELELMYNTFYDQIHTAQPAMAPDKVDHAARFKVKREIRGDVQSPAVWFEGVVLGEATKRDITEYNRKRCVELWKNENLRPALMSPTGLKDTTAGGYEAVYMTDAYGTPLDTREKFGTRDNRNYKKPLTSFFVKTIVGVARLHGGTAFKTFVLTLRAERTDMPIPLAVPVKFRANLPDDGDQPNRFVLSDSTTTKFESVTLPELAKMSFFEFFDKAPVELTSPLGKLSDWWIANAKDDAKIIFAQGDVSNIATDPNKMGSYTISIADETMADDQPSVPVFVPADMYKRDIDFGVASQVCVIGRLGQMTNDRGGHTYNITAYAMHARPELKIAKNVASDFDM